MGQLTDDMTRLCNEIQALRHARKAFINDLEQGFTAIQANVAKTRDGFRNARAEMARKSKAERVEFISNLEKAVIGLKKKVADLRQEFAIDMERTRAAWSGRGI